MKIEILSSSLIVVVHLILIARIMPAVIGAVGFYLICGSLILELSSWQPLPARVCVSCRPYLVIFRPRSRLDIVFNYAIFSLCGRLPIRFSGDLLIIGDRFWSVGIKNWSLILIQKPWYLKIKTRLSHLVQLPRQTLIF